MKFCLPALKAHFAQPYQSTTTCWLTVRQDGTVTGFTSLDQNIAFNLELFFSGNSIHIPADMVGSGPVTYQAKYGYTQTDIVTNSDLSVDNLEVQGPMQRPALVLDDILAGIWDYCFVIEFVINYADLTQGAMVQRCGHIGEITTERDLFKAELRGITQAYTRQIGELTAPGCRAKLGDARCKVNLGPFTFTGTITGVNPDGVTLYDTGRTEPAPVISVAITGITNANPGVVTMVNGSLGLIDQEAIVLSDIVGPGLLNAIAVAYGPSGSTFQLSIDTSDTSEFPPYVSGGLVTPLGASSGYFDNGLIIFNTTADPRLSGLSMEIKCYVVGQWTLYLPMPYTVAIGDTYTIIAGCDKSFNTCKNKFANVINMRAEPNLPGTDRLLAIPKPQ